MERPALEGLRSATLKALSLGQDSAARKNTIFENGKFKIVNAQPWLHESKNGYIFAQKDDVVITPATATKKEFKAAHVRCFLGTKSNPANSRVFIDYYAADGTVKKDGNEILVCDTKKGRNAFLMRKVERKGNSTVTASAKAEAAPF